VINDIIDIIGADQLFMVDGVQIVENPENEFRLLLEFFGIQSNLAFEFNENRGFYCLKARVFSFN